MNQETRGKPSPSEILHRPRSGVPKYGVIWSSMMIITTMIAQSTTDADGDITVSRRNSVLRIPVLRLRMSNLGTPISIGRDHYHTFIIRIRNHATEYSVLIVHVVRCAINSKVMMPVTRDSRAMNLNTSTCVSVRPLYSVWAMIVIVVYEKPGL